MDPHPFGKNSSSIAAQKITKKGLLGENVWLVGTVTRVRQKLPDESGGKNIQKNDHKKKGKAAGKDSTKSQNYEIHLNSGHTPADVIQVIAWEDAPRKKLEELGKMGASIGVHKAYIKEHDSNTLKWTTSRHPLYAVLNKDAQVKIYSGPQNWLKYHPVSRLPSLQYVPDERLVCIAFRVLSPGPRTEDVLLEGSSETVPKTYFHARAEDRIVLVEGWRETAEYAKEVKEGEFYFVEAIKRKEKKQEDEVKSILRYQRNTKHSACEPSLLKMLQDTTPDGWDDAITISPVFAGTSGMTAEMLQKIMDKDSPWLSLSVVTKIIEGKTRRKLQGSVQIPSVLIKMSDSITYVSCAECRCRGFPQKTCSCATNETVVRFIGKLRLEDDGSEERATVFDEMESLVEIFADGDKEKLNPEYYHDQLTHVEDLRMAIEAVPFTLLVTFDDSDYSEEIELSVKAIEKTFHADPKLIRHPRKPILRCIDNRGVKPFCPPCLVADTEFEEGAGVIKIPGGVTQKFRALLIISDKPSRIAKENDDSSPVVRCSRKVQCCSSAKESDPFYTLAAEGEINFCSQLLVPRKGDVISAVVTWRTSKELTLLSYAAVTEQGADLQALENFFLEEVSFYKTDSKYLSMTVGATPTKRQLEATRESMKMVTPEPWSKRNRTEKLA